MFNEIGSGIRKRECVDRFRIIHRVPAINRRFIKDRRKQSDRSRAVFAKMNIARFVSS